MKIYIPPGPLGSALCLWRAPHGDGGVCGRRGRGAAGQGRCALVSETLRGHPGVRLPPPGTGVWPRGPPAPPPRVTAHTTPWATRRQRRQQTSVGCCRPRCGALRERIQISQINLFIPSTSISFKCSLRWGVTVLGNETLILFLRSLSTVPKGSGRLGDDGTGADRAPPPRLTPKGLMPLSFQPGACGL